MIKALQFRTIATGVGVVWALLLGGCDWQNADYKSSTLTKTPVIQQVGHRLYIPATQLFDDHQAHLLPSSHAIFQQALATVAQHTGCQWNTGNACEAWTLRVLYRTPSSLADHPRWSRFLQQRLDFIMARLWNMGVHEDAVRSELVVMDKPAHRSSAWYALEHPDTIIIEWKENAS